MFLVAESKWKQWNISEQAHKFFVLRWRELFFEDTFDSWQVRSSNVQTVLGEILDSVDIVKREHAYHHNIDVLIEELIKLAKDDPVISSSFTNFTTQLMDLKQAYERYIKNQDKFNEEPFRRLVKVIAGSFAYYKNELIIRLKEIIYNHSQKNYKITFDVLIMSLAIEMSTIGYSIESLRESFYLLIDESEPSFEKRFDKLLKDYSGVDKEYICSFFVRWPGNFPDLEGYDVSLTRERPTHQFSRDEEKFYSQDKGDEVIASVSVWAKDQYSARYNSEEILEDLFALSKFYQVSKTAEIKHSLSLINTLHEETVCVGPNLSRLKYVKDVTNPQKRITYFAKIHKNLSMKDAGQLRASLQYHKLAQLAQSDESRLVNLWIALESLVQDGTGTIINRISRYIPKSNTTRHLHLFLHGFAISFKTLWREKNTAPLRGTLSKSDEYILHPFDLLGILLDEDNEPKISQFAQIVADDPLIIFRVSRLRDVYFKSPTHLSAGLERHRQNIEWQLKRIYRARNQILHQGICPSGTRQLIQHLHSYYSLVLRNIIHDLNMHDSWNISDALEHRHYAYEQLQAVLQGETAANITIQYLLDPAIRNSYTQGTRAWPALAKVS